MSDQNHTRLFFPGHTTHGIGILVHQPGMEPAPPAVEAWRLNHWTTRAVPTPESEAHKEKAVEGK